MLHHYTKIAFRSLLKFKGFTIINLTGLALGLASGILIMVYVLDEVSYDKFHTYGDRVFRVTTSFHGGDQGGGAIETNAWPIGDILRNEFPETEAVLYNRSASNLMIDYEGKKIRERIRYASPEFFKIFSFPITKSNTETPLKDPFAVVISKDMEEKYFAGGDALGKTITFNDTLEIQVTGVMENLPANSHIQLDMVVSFATYEKINPNFSYSGGWGNFNVGNYIMVKDGTDIPAFKSKAKNLYMEKVGDMMKDWGTEAYVVFEPLPEIYLKSVSGNSMGPSGSITRVKVLTIVGLFVILLACINFINLATARSFHRSKEVGIKKVVGSTKSKLITQFLSEAMITTLISFVIALVVVGLFLPIFNLLVEKNYTLSSLVELNIIGGILILLLTITICSGYYPAWVMAAFKPAEILKSKMQSSSRGVQLRRILVVIQFVISVGLVSGTLIVIKQLNYMQSRDLGFTKDEILVINVARVNATNDNAYAAFMNELKSQAMIRYITFCNALPAVSGWRGQIAYADGQTEAVDLQYMAVDENYLPTLGLELAAGNNFDIDRKPDIEDGLIINEKAVTALGWGTPENAIGKKIVSPSGFPQGTVIGVVKDFHDQGLQNNIGPIAMDYNQRNAFLYAIRFSTSETSSMLTVLSNVWDTYFPENEFNYFFLSETFAKQYQAEKQMSTVLAIFSVITIVIAVIGLFGLASFLIISKTKEIGIRKVMGASVWSLSSSLSREFLILVMVSNIVALPLVVYFAQQWLQGFAFRAELDPVIFIITFFIAINVTLLTVSLQTIKAAMQNPVNLLRYE